MRIPVYGATVFDLGSSMHEILGSLQPVIAHSEDVYIDRTALEEFCQSIVKKELGAPGWDYQHHFYDGTERTVTYLFVLDSLNFCFWGEPHWEITYKDEVLSGYMALAAALRQAIEEDIPIIDANFLSTIPLETLSQVLGGSGNLPLMEKRLAILREVGSVLKTTYQGQAHCLVEAASSSATQLVQMLVTDFPSFRDEASYKGHRVPFRKRAQIFVGDLYGSFQGKRWGEFDDLDQLTAFADYVLPQVLRQMGILQYSPKLSDRIDRQELFKPGSPEEVEIRAHTIWAVELIRRKLAARNWNLRAFEIDWLLWNMGQDPAYELKPYHRTLSIYY